MRIWLPRLAIIALLVGLALSVQTERTSACVCGMFPLPTLDEVDAVFAGKVVAVGTDRETVEFRVSRVWKGDLEETETMRQGLGGTSCSIRVTVGATYLAYAWLDDAGRLNFGNKCTTFRIEGAQDYPARLGPGWPPGTPIVEPVSAGTTAPEPPGTAAGTPDGPSREGDGPMVALLVVAALVLTGAAFIGTRGGARRA